MARNPNLRRCGACGSMTSVPARDGLCPYCKTPYGQAAQPVEVIDPNQPVGPDGHNVPPKAPEQPAENGEPPIPKARRVQPPQAPQNGAQAGGSEVVLRYVKLGRALEGPARAILEAAADARSKAKKGKKPSTAWANTKAVQEAIDKIEVAFASPEEQKRRSFEDAFAKARELADEGKSDEAYALVQSVFRS